MSPSAMVITGWVALESPTPAVMYESELGVRVRCFAEFIDMTLLAMILLASPQSIASKLAWNREYKHETSQGRRHVHVPYY